MWQLTKNKDWESLKNKFDWVAEMEGIPQDARHHAEGNVAIHTQMVVDELVQLPYYQQLSDEEKEVLWAAALMHDIEKRSTTVVEEDGSITSKNHAKRGERTVREMLYKQLPTPFFIREKIAKLVRYHGLPLWIFQKENPEKYLLQISLEVDTEMLSYLAEADVKGRICEDKNDLLYKIELFREFCKEQNCYGSPKAFLSNLSKFKYFKKEDQSADYQHFDDTKIQVIMLSGLPGTGKDTFIKKRFADWKVVSLDDIRRELKIDPKDKSGNGRVVQFAKESAKAFLRNQTPFIWNATNLTRMMREPLIDLFASYQAEIKLIYLEVSYQQLLQQNKNRQYAVPESAIKRMIEKLEIPALWEAHKVEYFLS